MEDTVRVVDTGCEGAVNPAILREQLVVGISLRKSFVDARVVDLRKRQKAVTLSVRAERIGPIRRDDVSIVQQAQVVVACPVGNQVLLARDPAARFRLSRSIALTRGSLRHASGTRTAENDFDIRQIQVQNGRRHFGGLRRRARRQDSERPAAIVDVRRQRRLAGLPERLDEHPFALVDGGERQAITKVLALRVVVKTVRRLGAPSRVVDVDPDTVDRQRVEHFPKQNRREARRSQSRS